MQSMCLRGAVIAAAFWTMSTFSGCCRDHEVDLAHPASDAPSSGAAGAAMFEVASAQFDQARDPSATLPPPDATVPDDGGCPNLTASIVGPSYMVVGDSERFTANADSDPPSTWNFEWSAGTGTLSAVDGAQTVYTCTEPGLQALALTAVQSGSCRAAIAMSIACTALE